MDQKYYLWYLRNKLVWKDEAGKEEAEEEPKSSATDVEGVEQPKEGFFKRIFGNLFKKKPKEEDPATAEPTAPAEEDEDQSGFNP